MSPEIPTLYNVPEAAGMFKVSVPLVRKWILEKKIMPTRLGRRVLISRDEIARWISANQERR